MALIDSGAGGNFIDEETVKQLQLTRTELRKPIAVRNVDGSHNNNGHITHRTIFDATIAGKRQTLSLLITGLGMQPIILGLPWLIKENPDINWTKGHLQWRNAALTVIRDDTAKKGGNFPKIPYLFDQTLNPRDPFLISLIETFEEPTIPADESSLDILRIKISDHFNQIYGKPETKQSHKELVPKLYHQFIDLFDKKMSERFPKPRPYDHEINLKPDFKPFKQAPYPLNPLQTKLAQDFIKENLDKGYITKSKSPMASPLFFVGKKDGSYRPCQDYRKLNEGTIKDAFPLPNIQDLLRDLQGKQYFTKLDI
jgi:hypothetical protein